MKRRIWKSSARNSKNGNAKKSATSTLSTSRRSKGLKENSNILFGKCPSAHHASYRRQGKNPSKNFKRSYRLPGPRRLARSIEKKKKAERPPNSNPYRARRCRACGLQKAK